MILPSQKIRAYDTTLANDGSYFTGTLNFEKLPFDPLITGYAFIFWIKLPLWVTNTFSGFKSMTEKNFKSLDGISDIEIQTQAYNYSFANNEYNVAAGIQKGNTEFTLKHQEYSGSPIKNGYQYWVSGMYDPETGISPYARAHKMDYAAKNHTGSLLYTMTRPDANNVMDDNIKNVEFSAFWTNCFPTKIPLSHLNYSQDNHDLVEIEQTFKGTIHLGPKVDTYATLKLKEAYAFMTEPMFDPNPDNSNSSLFADATIQNFTLPADSYSGDGKGEQIITTPAASGTSSGQ